MIPIELKKRYPHSREEDITDAFMRGYQACAAQGGDAEMDNCQVQAPQNYMQQSRHNDGTDLISRADAIEAVRSYFKDRLGKSKCDYDEELQVYVLGKEERTMLTYNKGINDKLRSLPSADAVQGAGRYENAMQKLREMPRYLNGVKEKQITKISDDAVPKMEHDREWIIGCIKHDGFIKTDRFDKANRIILDALSAKAEWIPCSERLPSKDGRYLVFMNWDYCNTEVLNWADGWNCHRGYDGKIRRESEIDGTDIIAWMPLPKPYKGGDDE